MLRFDLETWDHGRLVVNRTFANLLRRQHWTTFAVIWSRTAEAAVAKKMRTDRITLRFTLDDGGRQRVFYIKRHCRSSLKEYIKPLLQFRWPILGARNEWKAMLAFHEAGVPTMIPVACGHHGANSFVVTEALEDCTKLSELHARGGNPCAAGAVNAEHRFCSSLLKGVAHVTQRMHRAGLHHQDYYLGHLLLPNHVQTGEQIGDRIYVIDLGRARRQKPLATRWIVKDLAQLNFSSKDVSRTDRLRFLREYLGHKIGPSDKRLIARITAKTEHIARHTRKNSL